LNAHVLACRWQPATGDLTIVSDLPSLPDDWPGEPAAAAIRVHRSGATLLVSNRNHDSLAFFALDRHGRPTRIGHIAAGGKCPRDFAIDPTGRWLLVANQDSDRIAIHELDSHTGRPTGRAPGGLAVGTPACVLICDRRRDEGRTHG
jgi:6-phosphogluconolactonase